jgi:hypothetical protein
MCGDCGVLTDTFSALKNTPTFWDLFLGWGEGEIRGSLHCAVHGEAVNRFGRDDVFCGRWAENKQQQRRNTGILRCAQDDDRSGRVGIKMTTEKDGLQYRRDGLRSR